MKLFSSKNPKYYSHVKVLFRHIRAFLYNFKLYGKKVYFIFVQAVQFYSTYTAINFPWTVASVDSSYWKLLQDYTQKPFIFSFSQVFFSVSRVPSKNSSFSSHLHRWGLFCADKSYVGSPSDSVSSYSSSL